MQTKFYSHLMSIALATVTTLAVAFPLSTSAADLELSDQQPSVIGNLDSGSESAKATHQTDVYIVQLSDKAVASYMGGTAGLAATSNLATGASRLDTSSVDSVAYADYLVVEQSDFVADCEASFGRTINVKYKYQHAMNGMAMQLSPAEAKTIRAMPGVRSVERERIEVLATDAGPQWIGAPDVWGKGKGKGKGKGGSEHSQGEGIVVAVLDTGINHDHPSFADMGDDGYDHTNPLGSGNYVPGSYCDTVDPSFCNDKLIGAWSFVTEAITPEDSDGHGSHTASTAAGNMVSGATLVAPTTTFVRDVSGVAPHANIIAYDVCVDGCPGGALVAAVNQAIIDASVLPNGIHALNFSISGGGNPYSDAVEIGFLNATAAGIYVAASAGNAGPGASTNGHNGPWVATTASLTHNRATLNTLVDIDSTGGGTPDLTGVGLTSGYGPATIINSADLEGAFPGSTLCGLGSLGSFIPPWPPGTFNGEIVACTRGTFGRVEKGANVLAAGAGGYVLMDNGGGVVGDAHVLPGVHISQADGATLGPWITANAGNSPMATISGYFLDLADANGDIMAGTSSRGPNTINVIKPDIGAPGVNILAAESSVEGVASPEYQIISGTSMASPHNAGSGALLSAVRPDWTPYQIKSALMMTSNNEDTLKEDGATPTDPFDVGAGRIDLTKAQDAGLTLDETPANFLAADPALGGDPGTLNLASMQDGNCVGECSWTRTLTNDTKKDIEVDLKVSDGGGVKYKTHPKKVKVKKGKSKSITVTADTTLAPAGWNFADLDLKRKGKGKGSKDGPDLHMPIAINVRNSSNPDILTKTVDAATAAEGEPLNYEINVVNGPYGGVIDLVDVLPKDLKFVAGSENEVITGGSSTSPLIEAGGTLYSSFMLDQGSLGVIASPSPFGHFPLAGLGVPPFGFPSNCDDGAWGVGVNPFTYNGQTYTSAIFSVNGTLEAGTASGVASSFANQNLPDPSVPNNVLAPFWRDLNGCAGGELYVASLTSGPFAWTVFEWADVPHFGSPAAVSMQIWIESDGSPTAPSIHFTYGRIDNTGVGATVGVENDTGTDGQSYFYNGAGTPPAVGTDLMVQTTIGGTNKITFQAEIEKCKHGKAIVNRADISSGGASETAIAVTECVK